MYGAYSSKMSENKGSQHTPPSNRDAARYERWPGSEPTVETSAREEKSRADKPKTIASRRPQSR